MEGCPKGYIMSKSISVDSLEGRMLFLAYTTYADLEELYKQHCWGEKDDTVTG